MIRLLFALLLSEAAAVAVLLFHTPLHKVALLAVDRLKRGRGPLVVRIVAATGFVVLSSSLYSIAKIRSRSAEAGAALTATDQVLLSQRLLEASLMGYSLFLAMVIDRLHHYIREWRWVRKSMETVIEQNHVLEEQNRVLEGAKGRSLDELKARDEVIAGLNEQIKQMKLASEEHMKQAKKGELNATALTKQAEGLLLEYDRLLEENQNMRSQLQSIDRRLSHSHSKKNA